MAFSVLRVCWLGALCALAACAGSGGGTNDGVTPGHGDEAGSGHAGSGVAAQSGSQAPFDGTGVSGGAAGSGGSAAQSYAHVYTAATYTTLYAVSDVHGHLAELTTLLQKGGLIATTTPSSVVWTGGDSTLVIAGDMIDKGPASLEVLAFAMALQAAAKSAGGHVVVLLGNHEAEFLGTPMSSKFTGTDTIDEELSKQKPAISPITFASGADPRGAWLRTLPIAAKVEGWFFSHAGHTAGRTLAQLDADVTGALASSAGYTSDAFIGTDSPLEARDWYTGSGAGVPVVDQDLKALGATHIVFGHDPNAFGVKGILYAPPSFYGKLFRIDAGLGSGDSKGELLRVRHDGADEVAEAILPDGTTRPLFRGPP